MHKGGFIGRPGVDYFEIQDRERIVSVYQALDSIRDGLVYESQYLAAEAIRDAMRDLWVAMSPDERYEATGN